VILTALYDYYQRKPELPRQGLEWKEIPFLIGLRADGSFLQIEDTREGEGRHRTGKVYLVPQAVKKSVNIAANLLWGNVEYVLGVPDKKKLGERINKGKDAEYRDRLKAMHSAFRSAVQALPSTVKRDPSIAAVLAFLSIPDLDAIRADPLWPEVEAGGANLSFKLAGAEVPACSVPVPTDPPEASPAVSGRERICLVTGTPDEVERLHPPIKGVWGAQTSGANIVSFNLQAFTSYGREQGENAPIGHRAAFAYTTALNHLLASPQRIQVGDASTVFWAEKPNPMESLLAQLFEEPPKDDPDRGTRAVRALFASPRSGAGHVDETDPTRFYVLGLAPNAARIAVRFWQVATVGELARRIRQHFEDIRIVHRSHEQEFPSLFRLLVSTAVQGKADNIPPNLGGAVMKAILEGTPYPATLLQAAIRRVRAEREIDHARASVIKACVNRRVRSSGDSQEQEIGMGIDDNPNVGYRLGRLFAVLEKIQEEASPGINATIRDRYYGSASSTPATVFATLMRLKNHHLAKLENRGRAVNLERLISGVLAGVNEFPAHLTLPDQGRFAIGYYHQRHDLFTRHETPEGKDP
jgi:CRISPR-associated protein Csd1